MDDDGNGVLDDNEIYRAYQNFGIQMDLKDIRENITRGKKGLSIHEFKDIMIPIYIE